MAHDAIDALARALEADDMRSAVRAAQLVLDRAGYAPVTSVEDFYREHAYDMQRVIAAVLHRFGIEVSDVMIRAVVRNEVRRVADVNVLDDGEQIKVGYVSKATQERIASELRGEDVEPDTMVM